MKTVYPQLNDWPKAQSGTLKQQKSSIAIRKNKRPSNKKLTDVRRRESRDSERRR